MVAVVAGGVAVMFKPFGCFRPSGSAIARRNRNRWFLTGRNLQGYMHAMGPGCLPLTIRGKPMRRGKLSLSSRLFDRHRPHWWAAGHPFSMRLAR